MIKVVIRFPLARAMSLLLLASLAFTSPALAEQEETLLESTLSCSACNRFNSLNTLIRDGKIDRNRARAELLSLLPAIKEYYQENGGSMGGEGWVFPLRGYGPKAVSGGRRHGYIAGGYDFFDGNRHLGHPSFDIFIHDKNRDERDDASGEAVDVLSLTAGVVVARETSWMPGSGLRGGKYLWIYDPAADALVYYAHNRDLSVSVGDVVKPGDVIGHVGRSGFNAWKKRSPTHLHLTFLRINNGKMTPQDIHSQLAGARLVK